MNNSEGITADAIALQERDEFREAGWTKVVAPAKVNLHLAIGARRSDGYHDAVSIMHTLALHDVVYLRPRDEFAPNPPHAALVGPEAIEIAPEDNLAVRAVAALAGACGRAPDASALDIRIEKNIPAQAGLGGGSSDAAAALVGAAALWGIDPRDPLIERTARSLGADVAFFLHGGCAAFTGAGDAFARALEPSRRAVVLVKPAGGVSTAAAYRAFDEDPVAVPTDVAAHAEAAAHADEVALYNNLAPASERIMPELADVRSWLETQLEARPGTRPATQPGAGGALLCGSGAATFAPCDDMVAAARIVAAARERGWWARSTSFCAIAAKAVGTR